MIAFKRFQQTLDVFSFETAVIFRIVDVARGGTDHGQSTKPRRGLERRQCADHRWRRLGEQDAVVDFIGEPTGARCADEVEHAHGREQRRQALRQLKGLLGDKARNWRERIIEASALIEAGIDFSDEGDVSAELLAPARNRIVTLVSEIDEVLAAQAQGERLRDGLVVAITGPPNVGKSTLMNQLARREVAIVSPHAGTTRDAIEVQLDLDGYPVTMIDTAGIRETDDPVEQEGVRRARAKAAEADLVLWLTDSPDPGARRAATAPAWIVRNKVDLDAERGGAIGRANSETAQRGVDFEISAKQGDGIGELVSALVSFADSYFGGGEGGLITRERQRRLLEETSRSLHRSIEVIGQGDEFAAEDLRAAAYTLGRLLGRVDVEDILDVIFREFCIGK